MKTIAIVGEVDSRILVYPLMRALSLIGNVVVIADEGLYRRLYTGNEDQGTIGNVDIVVDNKVREDIIQKTDGSGVDYDYKIIISGKMVPKQCDYVIYCKGIDRSFYPEEAIEISDDIPHCEIVISFKSVGDKKIKSLQMSEAIMEYIFDIEETKQLKMLNNKKLNKFIAALFSEVLDIESGQLYNMLMRKDYKK